MSVADTLGQWARMRVRVGRGSRFDYEGRTRLDWAYIC